MISPYLVVSAALFAIGAFGVLARLNLLIILMSVEIMLNGVNVALLAFARVRGGSSGPRVRADGHGRRRRRGRRRPRGGDRAVPDASDRRHARPPDAERLK